MYFIFIGKRYHKFYDENFENKSDISNKQIYFSFTSFLFEVFKT